MIGNWLPSLFTAEGIIAIILFGIVVLVAEGILKWLDRR
jgi:hypothetical protein